MKSLYEKLNRLDDSLVESKTVVKKKKLTESYNDYGRPEDWEELDSSETMDDERNWQPLTLWKNVKTNKYVIILGDFTPWEGYANVETDDEEYAYSEFNAYLDEPYYNDDEDDEIDEMLTEIASFKSGDRYYGGLPSEPSMSEYGKAMDSARKNRDALLDKYDIKVDNDRSKGYTTYTGTINGHTFKYVEGHRDFSHWLSELVIDNKVVNPYKSSLNKIRKMFETNAVSISDIVHLLLKDNFDNIVYKEALTEGDKTKTYKYPSGSPVFKFDKFLENTKEDFVTVATSVRKAKSNIESQIKSKLGLTQNTSIKIDETKIVEIDNAKPTNKQESPEQLSIKF